jgi:hypothetical protein
MKIIITESQYKKVLINEFGVTENNPKKWYKKILKWVNGDRSKLRFESNSYETVVYDNKGIYLGYYDKEMGQGFVVKEYGIGIDDYTEEENILDEDEETSDSGSGGGSTPSGGASTKWPVADLNRGVSNTLSNDPHYTSGVHPFTSPWEGKTNRGPANQLS